GPLRWTVSTRDPVTIDAAGDPSIRTSYHLCVFDVSGVTPRLLARSIFAYGSPWRPGKGRFTYRARFGDERTQIKVSAGSTGKMAVRWRTPALLSLLRPLPIPIAMQLQTSDAGCFDARFSATGVSRNDPEKFRAVSDP